MPCRDTTPSLRCPARPVEPSAWWIIHPATSGAPSARLRRGPRRGVPCDRKIWDSGMAVLPGIPTDPHFPVSSARPIPPGSNRGPGRFQANPSRASESWTGFGHSPLTAPGSAGPAQLSGQTGNPRRGVCRSCRLLPGWPYPRIGGRSSPFNPGLAFVACLCERQNSNP